MPHEPDIQAVHRLNEAYQQLTHELGKVVVGQKQVIKELLVAMFARGHCLLVGVPGLAKTLTIRTVAEALALKFSRIQFTPDLMPSDITGGVDTGTVWQSAPCHEPILWRHIYESHATGTSWHLGRKAEG